MNVAHDFSVEGGTKAARASRFAAGRSSARQAARERIHASVVHPIDAPRLLRDPLERSESRTLSAIAGARLLVGAAILHGVVVVGFALVSRVLGEPRIHHPPERLRINIVEPPRVPPPPVPEPPKVEAAPVPEFAPVQPLKKAEPPPKKAPPPAAEPAVPPPAKDVPPEPAPRRVVGLSLESTVEGTGPAFATGTSRMGATDERAVDPKQAAQRTGAADTTTPNPAATSGTGQRAAAHIPTRDAQWVAPVRLRPNKPAFPPTLKAQNLEGDVVVSVDISAQGEVTRISIVRGSGYPEFDDAARQAAQTERFSPAQRDGKAVSYALTYTYRFRIED